jgi:hypothetical protein
MPYSSADATHAKRTANIVDDAVWTRFSISYSASSHCCIFSAFL